MPVRNQGLCGALEVQLFKKKNGAVPITALSLSEQNVIDCTVANYGCKGGWMADAWAQIANEGGIDTTVSYPYTGVTSSCRFNPANVVGTDKGTVYVKSGFESALLDALKSVGPISVAIATNFPSFHSYAGGVYSEPPKPPLQRQPRRHRQRRQLSVLIRQLHVPLQCDWQRHGHCLCAEGQRDGLAGRDADRSRWPSTPAIRRSAATAAAASTPSHCAPIRSNDAVLLVGYGTNNATDYWVVKNSWDTSWCLKGFIVIARNADNMCSIASYGMYPLV